MARKKKRESNSKDHNENLDDLKMVVKRDSNGRWISSGNPRGLACRDYRIVELRNHMRDKLPIIIDKMNDALNSGSDKLVAYVLKMWFDFSVPKVKSHDIQDMTIEAKAALAKICDLPVEDQPQALLKLFCAGMISEPVMLAVSNMVSIGQHAKDEAVERVLAMREFQDQ